MNLLLNIFFLFNIFHLILSNYLDPCLAAQECQYAGKSIPCSEHGICFYDLFKITTLSDYMTKAKFKQLRFIEWIKTNPVPLNSKKNYLTNAREIALLGVKGGNPTFNSEYDNAIYKYPICHDAGRFHPTQKPLILIEDLIKKHSNEGDNVLDCFSGSGTTAVACLNTNRNFYGCELNKEYFEKSTKRINDILLK